MSGTDEAIFSSRAAKLVKTLEQVSGADLDTLPMHVPFRLQTILGDEEAVYVDSNLSGRDHSYSGTILLFTTTRVIRASVYSATRYGGPDHGSHGSTTTVESWSRKSLESLSLDGADTAWDQPQMHGFRRGAGLTLHYPKEALSLPLATSRLALERLADQLPALIADLNA